MKLLLLILFTGFSICASAQNYIYYFEGDLDLEEISIIEKELSQVVGIAEAKVHMLEGISNGEVYLVLAKQPERSEGAILFTPVDVKKILIAHQLTPIQFIESK